MELVLSLVSIRNISLIRRLFTVSIPDEKGVHRLLVTKEESTVGFGEVVLGASDIFQRSL